MLPSDKRKLIELLLLVVVIGGAIGIALIALGVAGIIVPKFIIDMLWIVGAVVIAVLLIKFVASLISA